MKRTLTLLASLALVASGLQAVSLAAEEPPNVPDVANIEDPFGDANFLGGDQVHPADGGSLSDIGKVWFSQDASNFNVHILTEGAPGATAVGLLFEVKAGDAGCLVFEGFSKGTTYASDNLGRVTDNCNKLERTIGTFTFGAGPGTSGLATITVPRSYSPLFVDGGTITAPVAQTRLFAGGEQLSPTGYRGVGYRVDDTKPGTDHTISGGAPAKPTKPAKPAKPAKPTTPVKKGCDNGKGKKKGCPKTPPPAACAPFTPGEMGKDAKTTVVTDAATKDKPIEMDVPLGPATSNVGSDRTTRMKHNVQVDTTNPDAGLFVRLESPPLDDPDLYVYWPGGSQAAVAGGFNPLLAAGPLPPAHAVLTGLNGTGNGGHSEFTAEQIDGLRTADCQGWTLDLVNWAGRGGYKLKLWLGEVQNEPAAEQ